MLLADTSAWHLAARPQVIAAWTRAIEEDRLAITPPVKLELLYSTRGAREYAERAQDLDALIQVPAGSATFARALEVQRLLGEERALHHRSVKLIDLLIAAAAEAAAVTVWHYDEDYDRIASITGQATEWIAPRGSL
ncbi:MAG: PIN domain-containing protein [Candidatus Sericytochromatia bacterium]|nr:PIN domain-containing protein [Candidatus Tanganyikabacteria bacterium]